MSIELSNPAEGLRSERREKNGLRKSALVMPLRYGLPCVNCRLYYEADLAIALRSKISWSFSKKQTGHGCRLTQ